MNGKSDHANQQYEISLVKIFFGFKYKVIINPVYILLLRAPDGAGPEGFEPSANGLRGHKTTGK